MSAARQVHLAETDSTNSEALRRLAAGDAPPFWVTADRQLRGRGRRGKSWLGGSGNFMGSLALALSVPPAEAALRSFAAALALADGFDALGLAPERTALKWPNDVLVDGRKVAGILLETGPLGPATEVPGQARDSVPQGARRGPGPRAGTSIARSGDRALGLVIGFGVNLSSAPDPAEIEAGAVAPISLREAGLRTSPAELFAVLAPALAAREAAFVYGFDATRTAWLARAARLGTEITARMPGETLRGRFETVDATGALVLDTPTGRQHIAAAEIQF